MDELLARADSTALVDLLGPTTSRVLAALHGPELNTEVLQQHLVATTPAYALLSNSKSRNLLLELLPKEEAEALCAHLGLDAGRDPWATLLRQTYRARQLERLRGFFLVAPPPQVQRGEHRTQATTTADYPLFVHQRRAAAQCLDVLRRDGRRAVLHMPTGAGKTRTAMNIVATHLRETEPTVVVWLANSEELCGQAADEFERAWAALGNRDLAVYRMWGGKTVEHEELRDGFIVGGLQTLYGRLKRDAPWLAFVGDKCSLVVMDEAHQAVAASYQLILDSLVARCADCGLLGLTATPGRTWNDPTADAELAEYFHYTKVTLQVDGFDSPVDYLIEYGYLARPLFRQVEHLGTSLSNAELSSLGNSVDIPKRILDKLAADEWRTIKIIEQTEDLARRHSRIIVFSTSVEQATLLAGVLSSRGLPSRSITSQTGSAVRAADIAWFKGEGSSPRVLTNYGVLTTGFDAPRTSAALIARPTKSLVLFSQMVGRATRGVLAGGNKEAEIVTVVDTALPGFGDMAEAFNNWEDVW